MFASFFQDNALLSGAVSRSSLSAALPFVLSLASQEVH